MDHCIARQPGTPFLSKHVVEKRERREAEQLTYCGERQNRRHDDGEEQDDIHALFEPSPEAM